MAAQVSGVLTDAEARALAGRVVCYDRDTFVERVFRYHDGEHLSILGPTGWGKTTLALQLLGQCSGQGRPALTLVMKPRDETADRIGEDLGHKVIRTWPPLRVPYTAGPDGYLLWPKHTFDPSRDDPHLLGQFRKAVLDCYARAGQAMGKPRGTGCIVFGDEVAGLVELRDPGRRQQASMESVLSTLWRQGRSMDCGLWGATQRAAFVPRAMYSQAEHLFLGNDPDEAGRKRFGEIGGVNPRLVRHIVAGLDRYHWLYLRRSDMTMCIVGA